MKSRSSGGAVYVAASKPSNWLTLAPSMIALVAAIAATIVGGIITYNATIHASNDRSNDVNNQFLRKQEQTAYAAFQSTMDGLVAAQVAIITAYDGGGSEGDKTKAVTAYGAAEAQAYSAYIDIQFVGSPEAEDAAKAYYDSVGVWHLALEAEYDLTTKISGRTPSTAEAAAIEDAKAHANVQAQMSTDAGLHFQQVARRDIRGA